MTSADDSATESTIPLNTTVDGERKPATGVSFVEWFSQIDEVEGKLKTSG